MEMILLQSLGSRVMSLDLLKMRCYPREIYLLGKYIDPKGEYREQCWHMVVFHEFHLFPVEHSSMASISSKFDPWYHCHHSAQHFPTHLVTTPHKNSWLWGCLVIISSEYPLDLSPDLPLSRCQWHLRIFEITFRRKILAYSSKQELTIPVF